MQRLIDSEVLEKIRKSDIFETLMHSKNYLLADIATRAAAVISIPVFTRLLTEEEYGIVAVFNAYLAIFLIVLSLNAHTAVGRYYYEKTDDFGEFVGTTLILVGLILGITTPLFILLYRQVADVMQLPGSLPIYLVITCLLIIINEVYLQILIPQRRSKEVALIRTVRGYAYVSVAILFVFSLKENRYLGQIWANLLISFIFSIYFLIKIKECSKFILKSKYIIYIARYSFPLIPYSLSAIILAQFDRIMINNTLDAAAAGLYSLGYSIGMLLLIVIESTQTALIPDFFRFLDGKEYGRLDILTKRVFSMMTIAALGLILFAREIVVVLADKKFHPGLSVVPVVVIGYLFFGMFTVYNRYIVYEKKTVHISLIVLTAGILNIILNALFISRYGYVAAAYTTVASYFVMFMLTWGTVKMIFKQRITSLSMIWEPTVIMFGFVALSYYVHGLNLSSTVLFITKIIALVLFSFTVFRREIKVVCSEMLRV